MKRYFLVLFILLMGLVAVSAQKAAPQVGIAGAG